MDENREPASNSIEDADCRVPIILKFDLPQPAEQCSVLQDESTTAYRQCESLDHIHTQVNRPVEPSIEEPEISTALGTPPSIPRPKLPQTHRRSREAVSRRKKKSWEKNV